MIRLVASVLAIPLSLINALVLRRCARRAELRERYGSTRPFMEADPWG